MSGDNFIRAGQQPREEIKQPVWLMSFADFAGCLLASFVLLYSLAQTDRARMQAAFGIEATAETDVGKEAGATDKSMATKPTTDGRDTDYLATLLQTKIDATQALADIIVIPLQDEIVLELPLARIGSDGSVPREEDLLFALAGLLSVTPNESALRTDMPAGTAGDNWDKGMVIANALVRRLRDAGAPDTLLARTGLSTDGAAHVRVVIFREADEP
jgi:hypothetical protein